MKPTWHNTAFALAATFLITGTAYAENLKIAFIEPFSGTLGTIGADSIQALRVSEQIYQQGKDADKTHTLEFVEFDNKNNPQETAIQFKAAVDQGFRYVTQGGAPSSTVTLLEAINRHNDRYPGKEVLYIGWASNDPAVTNEKCSFWHFRMDAHTGMKIEALTSFMAKQPKIKKLYLFNGNYSTGQTISKLAKEYLQRKRPDIQIVGDDLIPVSQIKDFSPYVAKIKASGADSILTGNFGADLSLLVKAARDADLQVDYYSTQAYAAGAPSAIGASGADRLKLVSYYHQNVEGGLGKAYTDLMKKQYDKDFLQYAMVNAVTMLHQGFRDAKSTDPVKVAFAMEGMKFKSLTGELEMRKSDHQMQLPLYISNWTKVNGKDVKYDQEKTGYGWQTIQKLDAYVASQPTSCDMKRPTR